MNPIRKKLMKFRTSVREIMPYLTGYVYGLLDVERPGIGTMAVDQYGRLYWDPKFVEACTLGAGRFTVCHEALHVILDHPRMAKRVLGDRPTPAMLRAWNIAADLVVNQILKAWQHEAPEGIVTCQQFGFPEGLTIVAYYHLLMEQQEQPSNDPDQSGEGEDDDTEGDGDESDMETESDGSDGEREGRRDRSRRQPEGDDAGEEGAGDGDREGEEGEADPDRDPLDGDRGDGDEGEGDRDLRSQEDAGEGSQGGEGDGSEEPASDDDGSSAGGDGGGDECEQWAGGSGADGQPRSYELPPDPAAKDREYSLDQDLAAKIEEAEASRPGSVPGLLKSAVQFKHQRQVDPFDNLRAAVARATACPLGAPDPTYRRFARRQHPDLPRLHGVVKQLPNVVILLDTSGSMGLYGQHKRAAKALDCIAKGVRRLRSVKVVCFDSRLQDRKVISSMSQFQVSGGGGTDMAGAIEQIDREDRPDALVVVTDCETDWPEQKPRARVVVAAVSMNDRYPVPSWARVCDLTKGGA